MNPYSGLYMCLQLPFLTELFFSMLIPYITQKRDLNFMVKRERKRKNLNRWWRFFFVCYEFFFNVDGQSAALEKCSLLTKKKSCEIKLKDEHTKEDFFWEKINIWKGFLAFYTLALIHHLYLHIIQPQTNLLILVNTSNSKQNIISNVMMNMFTGKWCTQKDTKFSIA